VGFIYLSYVKWCAIVSAIMGAPQQPSTGPWNNWFHVTVHVYGSWLRGDPRGWRARHHREHVDGDYKNPPPKGKYDDVYEFSKWLMKRDPIRLEHAIGKFIADLIAYKLELDGCEVLIVSLSAKHLHVLARFPLRNPRIKIGWAKKYATQQLKAHGFTVSLSLKQGEGIWAKRSRAEPITNRPHQLEAFNYVRKHKRSGASLWTFRERS